MVSHLVSIIEHYGLFGIFVSMFIENIGVPLPTEGAFLVGQAIVASGTHNFWFMYWFIVFSQTVGAVSAYWIGYKLRHVIERHFAHKEKFIRTRETLDSWYGQYGQIIVLATRLVGYVRPWASLVAGFAEYRFYPFLLWSTVGTILLVYPTMKITALLTVVWERFPATHIIISAAVFVSFFGFLIFGHFRRRR